MTLAEIRRRIDRIDNSVSSLLGERMELAALVKGLKPSIEDSGRETAILDAMRKSARGLLDADFIVTLYKAIMTESKRVQALNVPTMGFQGVHGANSEAAARAWMPDCAPIPCPEFEDVFTLVSEGLVDYGILPVENTSGGIVGPVNELLIRTDLRIVGAVDMRISHCLLALPGVDYRDVHTVFSHPQALLQCRDFISRNKLEPRPFPDTAGAARMLAETRPVAAAALASPLAAELYGLDIIKENVQDLDDNRTRFVVLSRDSGEPSTDGDKCTAVFMAEHKAGSLFRILEVFAREGINLTRIESVPERPGEYAMFLDFLGSDRDPKVGKALQEARALNPSLRILGCYSERRI